MATLFLKHSVCRALMIFGILFAVAPLAAHAMPPDFTQTLVTAGITQPTDIAFAPDGRIFIAQKEGAIRLFKDNVLLPTPMLTLQEDANGERGLLSMTLDPQFAVNHFLYVLRTPVNDHQRISRFTVTGDIINPASEMILIENPVLASGYHTAGAVRFGADGKLYASFGSNGQNDHAQNLHFLEGKIIRLNSDGSVPADNPYVNSGTILPAIYASGFRNPWRFNLDNRGRLILADVGENMWEKTVVIAPKANYGWPNVEGNCSPSCGNLTPPLFVVPHNGKGFSIVGGDTYDDPHLPAQYRNQYFFSDYVQGTIRYAVIDAAGNATSIQDFASGLGAVSALEQGIDGCLYYLTIYPGALYKICYAPAIPPVTARASADVIYGTLPLAVNFSGSGSTSAGSDVIYSWDFGDGETASGDTLTHTFTSTGVYSISLSVRRGSDSSVSNLTIWAGHLPPVVSIDAPLPDTKYNAGDTLPFSATATDSDGNPLPPSAFRWNIIPHHGQHIHAAMDEVGVMTGAFIVPDEVGEPAANTWFEFALTVTDSAGLATSQSVMAYPNTTMLHIQTDPPGLSLLVDDQPEPNPYDVPGVTGFHRKISVQSPQVLNGISYDFVGWSDSGAITHTIITPAQETTYTAHFVRTPDPCDAAENSFTGCYYNDRTFTNRTLIRNEATINFDWNGGSPAPLIPQDNFSVRWQGNFLFEDGNYQFTAAADDGVRVYVDGTLIIDHFVDQPATTYKVTVPMTAGNHLIKMEYYEKGGNAVAKLGWIKLIPVPPPPVCGGTSSGSFTSCYFANRTLTAPAALTRTDALLNFDWAGNAPDPGLPQDNFSVRSDGDFVFEDGNYDFTATADDGVRVYLDGTLIIDHFVDQPATTYTVMRTMTAGMHHIKVEYFESGGNAVLKMKWTKKDTPPPPPVSLPPAPVSNCTTGTGTFIGCYYNDRTFTNRVLIRNDAAVNFDWNGGSPDAAVPQDNFSVRWQGNFVFEDGNYQFTATADDGVRVYVDGNVVIDHFVDQAATTYKVTLPMTAGMHLIRMDYYEKGGNAVAKLGWVKTLESAAVPPDCNQIGNSAFVSCYYGNMNFTNLKLTRTDAALNFDWGGLSPDASMESDRFSARSQGDFSFKDGVYTFTTTADDGIRVYMDDSLLIDHFVDQPATTYTVSRAMTAGIHRIRVEYYENSGNAVLKVGWERS